MSGIIWMVSILNTSIPILFYPMKQPITWKVVAKNGIGEEETSTIFSFTTDRSNRLPTSPALIFPANGATDVSSSTKLEWIPSIDPDGDAVTYNLYFGTNVASPNYQPLVASGLTTASYTFTELLQDQQTYYWRVVAVDGFNGQSVTHDGTINTWEFTVENYVADPPIATNLVSPENAASNVSFEVFFKWDPATDKDNAPLTYDIYADKNPNPQIRVATDLSTTMYTHVFEEYGQHYWRVVVKDGTGLLDDYPTFSFTTWDTEPSLNVEMVDIEGGSFMMGQSDMQDVHIPQFNIYDDVRDENPAHEVFLDDYKISKYEITNRQYVSFLNTIVANTSLINSVRAHRRYSFPYRNVTYNGRELCQVFDATRTDRPVGYEETYDSPIIWNGTSFELDTQFENHPVRFMYYQGALWFSKWLGNFRLPTEAEWEYAAIGGKQSQGYTYSGSDNHQEVAVHNIGAPIDTPLYTSPIGSLLPNELGIYDMTGNVQEICEDYYSTDYYSNSPVNNPINTLPAGGLGRSVRGGNYKNPSEVYLRVKKRWRLSGAQYINDSGIRLAAKNTNPQNYGLNGTVFDPEGNPLSGVRLNGFTNVVETDANGDYNTSEVSGWSGTIIPQLQGYELNPESIAVNSLQRNETGNFTGTLITMWHTVSGRVTDASGNPLDNVTINGFTNNVSTDVNGNYSTNEATGWSGDITPQLQAYAFNPEHIEINNISSHETDKDFVGTAIATKRYNISGQVTECIW